MAAVAIPQVGWCTTDLRSARNAGFDYAECGIRNVAALPDEMFEQFANHHASLQVPTPVGNVLLPPQLKVVGNEIDSLAEERYVRKALSRAQRLGVQLIVFGSARSRTVPEGFSRERAFAQLVQFGIRLSRLAADSDMTVALEPVGRPEGNIVVDSREAAQLVAAVAQPNFKLMIDLYHWHQAGETVESLRAVASDIKHIHVAHPVNRQFPQEDDAYDYRPFFETLRAIGYRGRTSIEGAVPRDLGRVAPRSIAFLRSLAGERAGTSATPS